MAPDNGNNYARPMSTETPRTTFPIRTYLIALRDFLLIFGMPIVALLSAIEFAHYFPKW